MYVFKTEAVESSLNFNLLELKRQSNRNGTFHQVCASVLINQKLVERRGRFMCFHGTFRSRASQWLAHSVPGEKVGNLTRWRGFVRMKSACVRDVAGSRDVRFELGRKWGGSDAIKSKRGAGKLLVHIFLAFQEGNSFTLEIKFGALHFVPTFEYFLSRVQNKSNTAT